MGPGGVPGVTVRRHERDRSTLKLTKRVCRWCRRECRAPKGERWKGCLDCAPQLEVGTGHANPAPLDEAAGREVSGF